MPQLKKITSGDGLDYALNIIKGMVHFLVDITFGLKTQALDISCVMLSKFSFIGTTLTVLMPRLNVADTINFISPYY